MDKRKITDSFSSNNEEKYLIALILDLAEECETKNIIRSSYFLSESEAALVEQAVSYAGYNYTLFGGTENSERKCFVFVPYSFYYDDYTPTFADLEVSILSIQLNAYHSDANLTHRDYLGAIIGCGVKREMIGDIYVTSSGATVVLKSSIFSYIADSLKEVGRYKVKCTEIDHIPEIEAKFKEVRTTVASMRIDGVISAAFNLSRTSASELIREGRVFVNSRPVSKPDLSVDEGDKISARGKGKIVISQIDGKSAKGRYRLVINKYI